MGDFFGGGSTRRQRQTTTQTGAPGPGAMELQVQQQNAAMAQAQQEALQRAIAQQQAWEQSPQFAQLMGLGTTAAGNLQAQMQGGPLLTPAQQAALEQMYAPIRQQGLGDITRMATEAAARRGLSPSDSPIGNQMLRQTSDLASQLAGQQAGSALNLNQQNTALYQNLAGFQQALQQAAQQNRMALAQAQPGGYNFGAQLAQQRIQGTPRTQTTTGGGMSQGPTFGGVLGGLGQVAGGLGGLLGGLRNPQTSRYPWQGTPTPPQGPRPRTDLWGTPWGAG